MKRVSVSPSGDQFFVEGKPYFLFADTVWAVFSNASVEEWAEYLSIRKRQHFNAVQISVLPVLHDTSDTYTGIEPFERNADGTWNFHRIDDAFFDRAETMAAMACAAGFVPILVALWCNYVPGTWANKARPDATMPKESVAPFSAYVAKRFAKYNPLYFISGDTAFEDDQVNDYFMTSLRTIKENDPQTLTAMHIVGGSDYVPDLFAQSELLDFYIYQSGHDAQHQEGTYRLAQKFMQKPVQRPVMNSEPCYEGHGHGNKFGRFDAFHLRKAFWSSVLSGAKAGFTYGAHGVWSWHRKGAPFTSEGWSKMPFDWRTAVHLRGAYDTGYAAWLFTDRGLNGVQPGNDYLLTEYEDIRVGVTPGLDQIAVYVPYSQTIELKLDMSGYDVTMFDLAERLPVVPDVRKTERGTAVGMHQGNADVLILATKRG